MSEQETPVEPETEILGEIKLTITSEGIVADTEFTFQQMMFWLNAAQHQFYGEMFTRV